MWCDLGLWLGTWSGSIRRELPTGSYPWLRFYDRQENLVLLPQEEVEQEQERASLLAARLRDLGEDVS